MKTPAAAVRPSIRIMCVDDHALMRVGIAETIARQPDMEMVGTVGTAEEALSLARVLNPNIVLVDLRLPGMSGTELIRSLSKECPTIRTIVLTMYHGDEDIYRALEAGASTCLLKDGTADDLIGTIRSVSRGEKPRPPVVQRALAERSTHDALTAREMEVAALTVQGMRNRDIALALGITEETVKAHLKNIRLKLGVNDKSSIVSAVLRRGIVHFE